VQPQVKVQYDLKPIGSTSNNNSVTVAFAGKGSSGKTFLTYLLFERLSEIKPQDMLYLSFDGKCGYSEYKQVISKKTSFDAIDDCVSINGNVNGLKLQGYLEKVRLENSTLHTLLGGSGKDEVYEWDENKLHKLINLFQYLKPNYSVRIFDFAGGWNYASKSIPCAMADSVILMASESQGLTEIKQRLEFTVEEDFRNSLRLTLNQMIEEETIVSNVIKYAKVYAKLMSNKNLKFGDDDFMEEAEKEYKAIFKEDSRNLRNFLVHYFNNREVESVTYIKLTNLSPEVVPDLRKADIIGNYRRIVKPEYNLHYDEILKFSQLTKQSPAQIISQLSALASIGVTPEQINNGLFKKTLDDVLDSDLLLTKNKVIEVLMKEIDVGIVQENLTLEELARSFARIGISEDYLLNELKQKLKQDKVREVSSGEIMETEAELSTLEDNIDSLVKQSLNQVQFERLGETFEDRFFYYRQLKSKPKFKELIKEYVELDEELRDMKNQGSGFLNSLNLVTKDSGLQYINSLFKHTRNAYNEILRSKTKVSTGKTNFFFIANKVMPSKELSDIGTLLNDEYSEKKDSHPQFFSGDESRVEKGVFALIAEVYSSFKSSKNGVLQDWVNERSKIRQKNKGLFGIDSKVAHKSTVEFFKNELERYSSFRGLDSKFDERLETYVSAIQSGEISEVRKDFFEDFISILEFNYLHDLWEKKIQKILEKPIIKQSGLDVEYLGCIPFDYDMEDVFTRTDILKTNELVRDKIDFIIDKTIGAVSRKKATIGEIVVEKESAFSLGKLGAGFRNFGKSLGFFSK